MRRRILALALALVTSGLAGEALAVIGRPLTPVSYAGVARRTSRRSYAYGATAPYAYGTPAYSSSYVTTPPAGCTTVVTSGTAVKNCGGTNYQPYYDGGNVVYHAGP